ncbi:6218_t:CDS:2, partial [Acaulospora colombiana]
MPVASFQPNAPGSNRKRKRSQLVKTKIIRRNEHSRHLEDLEKRIATLEVDAASGTFADMPLSDATKKDIQARSLPYSLQGKDVLGAARTGSGKTLAFLIPVLENLLRNKWGPQDGLGALIISPTRELAMQIFDVLRIIGCFHTFSAGLVIGGKNLKEESDRLSRMNILVATPGRLLQHLDQT